MDLLITNEKKKKKENLIRTDKVDQEICESTLLDSLIFRLEIDKNAFKLVLQNNSRVQRGNEETVRELFYSFWKSNTIRWRLRGTHGSDFNKGTDLMKSVRKRLI